MTTTQKIFDLKRTAFATLVSLISVAPAMAADAENKHDPVRPGDVLGLSVSQGIEYDSNVFRLSDDSSTTATRNAGQRHDFISTTGLRVGLDKDFGRHRVFLLAAPSLVRYGEFSQFDYVGQNFLADLSARLGTAGFYDLNYQRTKVATNPADQLVPTGNRATKDQVALDLGLPTGSHWQAVTGWHTDRTRNSAPSEQGGDNEGWAGDLGVRYMPTTGNNIDLRYRRSRYNYPNVIPSRLADNTYTQNEVELSTNWQLTEPSRLEGRTSYVRRRHDNFQERDFSGWIGSVKYIWRPTVDTSTSVQLFKDLGAVTDGSASYARTWGLSVQPAWDLSAKLALGSVIEFQRRSYDGFSLVPRATERTAKVGLNARYKPTRSWQLGVSVADEHRYSSDSTREYSDVLSSVVAQWQM